MGTNDTEIERLVTELLDEVMENKVALRTLPNQSQDFPLEEASDSFDHFIESSAFTGAIDRAYKPR